MYEYRAKLIRVIDGDTMDLDIDLGFKIHFKERVRLIGVNTPEIFGRNAPEEKESGMKSKEFVENFLTGKDLIIRTHKDRKGKYGRYLAEIIAEGKSLNGELIRLGYGEKMEV